MRLQAEGVTDRMRFDAFFEDEYERLFKALYFVTGNRQDSEDILQDAFLKLWERWDRLDRIEDPTAYLFRVALNGFRMARRRAVTALRKAVFAREQPDVSCREAGCSGGTGRPTRTSGARRARPRSPATR